MKKILVPIDNSKLSTAAVTYALDLAESIGAEVILLSVINASSTSRTLASWRKIEQQMVARVLEDVAKMRRDLVEKDGISRQITHRHVLGFPVHEVINRFVTENKIDLVVMGTKGAAGLKKLLAGTNTTSVIGTSSVPVIAIPKTKTSNGIRKIVYATDMSHLDEEIKTIAKFARPFDADIEVVHFAGKSPLTRNHSHLQSILARMAKYPRIHVSVTKDGDVVNALRAFAVKNKADLIVMFTHHPDFFEKVFGKSNTRRVAFESTVPLLTFNRTNSHL
jgi:nucleotide-binding universal stress UspA family protein